jgi:hypothetical protein
MSGNAEPYDFQQARDAINSAKTVQAQAEAFRRDAAKALASAEQTYRIALAKKIVEVHAAGAAWTVAQDLARGDEAVAQLRYLRDVARGVLDAAEQAGWRHAADRKDLGRLVDWSRGVAPDGQTREPPDHLRRVA